MIQPGKGSLPIWVEVKCSAKKVQTIAYKGTTFSFVGYGDSFRKSQMKADFVVFFGIDSLMDCLKVATVRFTGEVRERKFAGRAQLEIGFPISYISAQKHKEYLSIPIDDLEELFSPTEMEKAIRQQILSHVGVEERFRLFFVELRSFSR